MTSGSIPVQLTVAQLRTKKSKLKGVIVGLGTLMLLVWVVMLYLAVTSKTYWLLAVGLSMFVTLTPSLVALNKLNMEIKQAEVQNSLEV
ncbi:hypothetical protein [Hymenobacter pini]|uniref:hypothetical protein n=1 Tax=Hymenobacter pini TaxID=2880879 RepID=UPI001CF22B88|nr:hypothetical protein [Hymenobacter pini]MCA8832551.1 hypothetical protein [Hymenobacter pini]